MKSKLNKFLGTYPVQLLCRAVLGGIFIYAGLTKIGHSPEFAKIIFNYHLLPASFIPMLTVTLPWIELTAGIFLLAGIFTRSAALLLTLFLGFFMAGILINTWRGISLACGCFSLSTAPESAAVLLVRDALIAIPGIVILLFFKKEK